MLNLKRDYELDAQQRALVEAPFGIILGEAIAGSGKTRCLTHRVANLIDHGIDESQILMVTFTNKAAREMKERIAQLLNKQMDQLNIVSGTFHSIALEYLKKLNPSVRYDILDQDDDLAYLKLAKEEYLSTILDELTLHYDEITAKDIVEEIRKRTSPKVLHQLISNMINFNKKAAELIDEAIMNGKDLDKEHSLKIMKYFLIKKRNANFLNFDDILLLFLSELKKESTQQYFKQNIYHVLVDEYQDINWLQFHIVKLLNQNNSLFVIGDKAQSIYGWRGSQDVFIVNFKEYFPDAQVYTIDNNYRSSSNILKIAEKVIHKNYKDMNIIGRLGPGIEVSCQKYNTPKDESVAIIDSIQDHKLKGKDRNNMCVLFRSRREIGFFEAKLKQEDIPYRIFGAGSLFDRAAVKQLIYVVKALNNMEIDFIYSSIFSLFKGTGLAGASKIVKLLMLENFDFVLASEKNKKYQRHYDVVKNTFDIFHEKQCLGNALQYFYDEVLLPDYLTPKHTKGGIVDYDALNTDILFCQNFISVVEEYTPNDIDKLVEEILLDPNKHDEDSQEDMLNISTIHSAKGLEWDIVYMPSMAMGIFPMKEATKEEINLCYVAFTRAKEKLFLSYYQYFMNQVWKPSIFLKWAQVDGGNMYEHY